MSPQTPTGSLIVKTLLPAMEAFMVSPSALGASSLNHSKKPAAYATSPFASAKGLPFSQVMSLARSSWLSIINWYHLRSMRDLSLAVVLRKEGNAAAAMLIAFSASSLEHSGHVPISLLLDGSVRFALSKLQSCVELSESYL